MFKDVFRKFGWESRDYLLSAARIAIVFSSIGLAHVLGFSLGIPYSFYFLLDMSFAASIIFKLTLIIAASFVVFRVLYSLAEFFTFWVISTFIARAWSKLLKRKSYKETIFDAVSYRRTRPFRSIPILLRSVGLRDLSKISVSFTRKIRMSTTRNKRKYRIRGRLTPIIIKNALFFNEELKIYYELIARTISVLVVLGFYLGDEGLMNLYIAFALAGFLSIPAMNVYVLYSEPEWKKIVGDGVVTIKTLFEYLITSISFVLLIASFFTGYLRYEYVSGERMMSISYQDEICIGSVIERSSSGLIVICNGSHRYISFDALIVIKDLSE